MLTDLRFINVKTAISCVKECTPATKPRLSPTNIDLLSKAKTMNFSPRSIIFGINKQQDNRKKDPLIYIPIVNPRSILPLIDSNLRKDEIGLPAIDQEEKQAVRLIVIRRKKMKKHQRRKLWKRMRHRWARVSIKYYSYLHTFC